MKQYQQEITLKTAGQKLYPVTRSVEEIVEQAGVACGLCTVFCKHTSASLLIQENADPDVALDLAEFFSRIAPEGMQWLRHTLEGPDDMPAHLKAALTATSLVIPIARGRLTLGTWQGIFLFEHRLDPHRRQLFVHISGE